MEATKVTITPETLRASQKKLTLAESRRLRERLIKEYILSKPAGTLIPIVELGRSAGLTAANSYAIVKRMRDQGLIVRTDSDHTSPHGSWSVPGTAKTIVERTPLVAQRTATAPEDTTVPVGPPAQPVVTISVITREAKDFAWSQNSDSLREFIRHLNEKHNLEQR